MNIKEMMLVSECFFVARGPFGGRANREGDKHLLRIMSESADGGCQGFGVRMTAASTVVGPTSRDNARLSLGQILFACPEMRTDEAGIKPKAVGPEGVEEIRATLGLPLKDQKPTKMTPSQKKQMRVIDAIIAATVADEWSWSGDSVGYEGYSNDPEKDVRLDFRRDGNVLSLRFESGCRRVNEDYGWRVRCDERVNFPEEKEPHTKLIETNGKGIYHGVMSGHPYYDKFLAIEEAAKESIERRNRKYEQERLDEERRKKAELDRKVFATFGLTEDDNE